MVLAHEFVGKQNSKKVFVLLHGMLGNKSNWKTFSKSLQRKMPDSSILLMDHRGHGDSPNVGNEHTLSHCALDVKNTLQALNVEPKAIIGHSFGGKVALAYQQEQKNVLQTWVLDALPGIPPSKKDRLSSVDEMIEALGEMPSTVKDKQFVVESLMQKGIPNAQALWMTTNLKRSEDKGHYVWKFDLNVVRSLYASFLCTDFVPLLNSKHGAHIHIVMAERNKQWTDKVLKEIQHGNLHWLKNADHWVHVDNPSGLLSLLTPHLVKL